MSLYELLQPSPGFSDPGPEGARFCPSCDYALAKGGLLRVNGQRLWLCLEEPREAAVEAALPLLVLHGGPGVDHRSLHSGMSVLARRRQLICYDRRGHYMSDEDPALRYGMQADIEDAAALIELLAARLGVAPHFDVLGHSWGGLVALRLAQSRPELVRRLIVCSTPVGASEEEIEARLAADPHNAAVSEAEARGADETELLELYLRFYYEQPVDAETRRFAALVREAYGTQKNLRLLAALEEAAEFESPDWPGLLTSLACPALFVYGAEDPVVVPEALESALRPFSGLRSLRIEGARHDPFADQPQLFAEAVEAFLGEAADSAPEHTQL